MNKKNKDKEETDLFGKVDQIKKHAVLEENKKRIKQKYADAKKANAKKLKAQKEFYKDIERKTYEANKAKIDKQKLDLKEEIKTNIEPKALKKLNIYKQNITAKKEFQQTEPLLEDVLGIMEFLVFSSTNHGFWEVNMTDFFDSSGSFILKSELFPINSEYNPSATLYSYFQSASSSFEESFLKKIDKYNSNAMNNSEIIELQNEGFYILLDYMNDELYDYIQFIPQKKINYLAMLDMAKELYPYEIKRVLDAFLDFLFDQEASNNPSSRIEVVKKNNTLILKLNILTEIEGEIINYYSRIDAIYNTIYGGLIMNALGAFNRKTPKVLQEFLLDRTIDVGMRWRDPRTKNFEKNEGYTERETYKEYRDRHRRLAFAWNDGLFGGFSTKIEKNLVTLVWNYPNFFVPYSDEDIKNDESNLIRDMLDLTEGNRFPSIPYDLKLSEVLK